MNVLYGEIIELINTFKIRKEFTEAEIIDLLHSLKESMTNVWKGKLDVINYGKTLKVFYNFTEKIHYQRCWSEMIDACSSKCISQNSYLWHSKLHYHRHWHEYQYVAKIMKTKKLLFEKENVNVKQFEKYCNQ